MKYFVLLPLYIILHIGCSNGRHVVVGSETPNLPIVALSALKQNPEARHGQKVELIGYYYSAWETVGLFPDEAQHYEEAVWVGFSKQFRAEFSSGLVEVIEGRRIRMQGFFDHSKTGHMNMYIGTIEIDFLETLD